jgi:Zn-dependent membrane protease YugP
MFVAFAGIAPNSFGILGSLGLLMSPARFVQLGIVLMNFWKFGDRVTLCVGYNSSITPLHLAA